MNNGDILRQHAERLGLPLATLNGVKDTIEKCKQHKSDASMARLMIRHGRMTNEARCWLVENYPQ